MLTVVYIFSEMVNFKKMESMRVSPYSEYITFAPSKPAAARFEATKGPLNNAITRLCEL